MSRRKHSRHSSTKNSQHSMYHSEEKSSGAHKKSTPKKSLTFDIDHLDAQGQGVSKSHDAVSFIKKTLPGEICTATVYKQKKNINFALLDSIQTPALNRIEAECPHYQECPGCQYLHTDYQSELSYKRQALEQHFKHSVLADINIEIFAATQRFAYRNRIQLHYDTRNKSLGLINGIDDSLIEIPQCKIIRNELKGDLQKLYQEKDFKKPPTKLNHQNKIIKNTKGHCEIYLKNNEVHTSWNKPYADGGFSQVNEEINKVLLENILHLAQYKNHQSILDLFSGSGNLSKQLFAAQTKEANEHQMLTRTMVDNHSFEHEDFIQMNLHDTESLANFTKRSTLKSYDLMIVDPPRKGFPDLHLWLKKLKPKQLIYVSCYPVSLARDLLEIKAKFRDVNIQLLDMFPGTQHFETLVSIDFKKH